MTEQSIPFSWRLAAWGVLFFWLALCVPIVLVAPQLIGETSVDVRPPSGSRSIVAQDMGEQYFGGGNSTGLLILVTAQSGTVLTSDVRNFTGYAIDLIKSATIEDSEGSFNSRPLRFDGYYLSPVETRRNFVSKTNSSTIIEVSLEGEKDTKLTNGYIKFIRDQVIDGHILDPSLYKLYLAGEQALNMDGQEGTLKDIENMEKICVPVAFLIFCYFLRSIKFILAPVLSIVVSIGASFAMTVPFAKFINFFTITPSIMLSLGVALSVDYNLFILIRFKKSTGTFAGIKEVMKYTAHTILISGTLIAVAVAGLIMVPCEPISATGVGSCISVICTVVVNLTLTPAILVIFGDWLRRPFFPEGCFTGITAWCGSFCKAKPPPSDDLLFHVNDDILDVDNDDLVFIKPSSPSRKVKKSFWLSMGRFISRHKYICTLLVLLLGAPFYSRLPELRMNTLDQLELLPRGARSVEALHALKEDFAPGIIHPYTIIANNYSLTGDERGESSFKEGGLFSQAGFDLFGDLAARIIIQNPMFSNDSFLSPMFLPFQIPGQSFETHYLNFEEAQLLLMLNVSYNTILEKDISMPEHKVMTMSVFTPFDPMGHLATEWIKDVRVLIDVFNAELENSQNPAINNTRFYLFGGSCPVVDFSEQINDSFAMMLGCVVALVMFLVLLMFRSLMIPFRLAFTLLYTLAVAFGFTFYVYQTDAFHWLFTSLHEFDGDAIQWLVPSLTITIIIGLGLDYDIYLLSRVEEIRVNTRCTDEEAIVQALQKTGSVISGAGIIMAIAFSGLMMSSVVVLNQFGVLLCVSVILDTFVIRTILLPAIMMIAGQWNWWPRKMPEPYSSITNGSSDTDDDDQRIDTFIIEEPYVEEPASPHLSRCDDIQ
eukprot:TRINITY_DN1251_c5_g1_i1.p1 TRINITY_DN1251_c5_g1~~TRINITY_DN1251_c5_g1_i1.p1  ORF type:complete len:882 (+),score=137.92 TRINITY_DN1251_c5_g1_i1:102-2747(+)